MTFYYTNQQSARLMFYHDHAYGSPASMSMPEWLRVIWFRTRQRSDRVDLGLHCLGIIPATQIPLVIQDKTFVDAAKIATATPPIPAQDPTWIWGTTPGTPKTGDLWFPHVYMPNQRPDNPDLSGANNVGRWDYGPWFWPPLQPAQLAHPPINGTGTNGCPVGVLNCPGTPNPSLVPEAFMDMPIVNGAAYPTLTVAPQAYRFRILNAGNDRMLNLQLYQADPTFPAGFPGHLTEVKMVPAVPHVNAVFNNDWTQLPTGSNII